MEGKHIAFILLVAVGLWQGVQQWRLRPVHPPDGLLAPAEPRQMDLENATPITHGRWKLIPRVRYDITARILSREDYQVDPLSDLIPEDLALGWGTMSDNAVLRSLDIKQAARFYRWRPVAALPIPVRDVIGHSANTHVIPADPTVRAKLARLRVGQVVHLTGLLVDGRRDDGLYIQTSLSREDSGAGACEVMLVDDVGLQ